MNGFAVGNLAIWCLRKDQNDLDGVKIWNLQLWFHVECLNIDCEMIAIKLNLVKFSHQFSFFGWPNAQKIPSRIVILFHFPAMQLHWMTNDTKLSSLSLQKQSNWLVSVVLFHLQTKANDKFNGPLRRHRAAFNVDRAAIKYDFYLSRYFLLRNKINEMKKNSKRIPY